MKVISSTSTPNTEIPDDKIGTVYMRSDHKIDPRLLVTVEMIDTVTNQADILLSCACDALVAQGFEKLYISVGPPDPEFVDMKSPENTEGLPPEEIYEYIKRVVFHTGPQTNSTISEIDLTTKVSNDLLKRVNSRTLDNLASNIRTLNLRGTSFQDIPMEEEILFKYYESSDILPFSNSETPRKILLNSLHSVSDNSVKLQERLGEVGENQLKATANTIATSQLTQLVVQSPLTKLLEKNKNSITNKKKPTLITENGLVFGNNQITDSYIKIPYVKSTSVKKLLKISTFRKVINANSGFSIQIYLRNKKDGSKLSIPIGPAIMNQLKPLAFNETAEYLNSNLLPKIDIALNSFGASSVSLLISDISTRYTSVNIYRREINK